MTEGELQILRLRLEIEAIRVLVRGFYTLAANTSPSVAQAFRDQFESLRQEHAGIAVQRIPPEYSDQMAAEYQEALDDLLSFIESGFHN